MLRQGLIILNIFKNMEMKKRGSLPIDTLGWTIITIALLILSIVLIVIFKDAIFWLVDEANSWLRDLFSVRT